MVAAEKEASGGGVGREGGRHGWNELGSEQRPGLEWNSGIYCAPGQC